MVSNLLFRQLEPEGKASMIQTTLALGSAGLMNRYHPQCGLLEWQGPAVGELRFREAQFSETHTETLTGFGFQALTTHHIPCMILNAVRIQCLIR